MPKLYLFIFFNLAHKRKYTHGSKRFLYSVTLKFDVEDRAVLSWAPILFYIKLLVLVHCSISTWKAEGRRSSPLSSAITFTTGWLKLLLKKLILI